VVKNENSHSKTIFPRGETEEGTKMKQVIINIPESKDDCKKLECEGCIYTSPGWSKDNDLKVCFDVKKRHYYFTGGVEIEPLNGWLERQEKGSTEDK